MLPAARPDVDIVFPPLCCAPISPPPGPPPPPPATLKLAFNQTSSAPKLNPFALLQSSNILTSPEVTQLLAGSISAANTNTGARILMPCISEEKMLELQSYLLNNLELVVQQQNLACGASHVFLGTAIFSCSGGHTSKHDTLFPTTLAILDYVSQYLHLPSTQTHRTRAHRVVLMHCCLCAQGGTVLWRCLCCAASLPHPHCPRHGLWRWRSTSMRPTTPHP